MIPTLGWNLPAESKSFLTFCSTWLTSHSNKMPKEGDVTHCIWIPFGGASVWKFALMVVIDFFSCLPCEAGVAEEIKQTKADIQRIQFHWGKRQKTFTSWPLIHISWPLTHKRSSHATTEHLTMWLRSDPRMKKHGFWFRLEPAGGPHKHRSG